MKGAATRSDVERFGAMGTRVELHRFGGGEADALARARRAVEAVDDALTIHRPSATTMLNAQLLQGRSAAVDDPILWEALSEVDTAYAETDGLFDPAADRRLNVGWNAVLLDTDNARVEATQPLALDFGGFGKGFALDCARDELRRAGVAWAFLTAGESSVAVVGGHPLGGAWLCAIPDPLRPDQTLLDVELDDEGLSISSTVGRGADAPGRAPFVRPSDGAIVNARRCAVVRSGRAARAEAVSTALIVADYARTCRLLADRAGSAFLFRSVDGTAGRFEWEGYNS